MQSICPPQQLTHTIHTRSKPQRTVDNLPNLKVSAIGAHRNRSEHRSNTTQLSIDKRTRRTQLGASRTAAAHPRPNTAPKHHHFNMGTGTRTDRARISKFRQREPTRRVWDAVSNATPWPIDNTTRTSSESAAFACGRIVNDMPKRGVLPFDCRFGSATARISNITKPRKMARP